MKKSVSQIAMLLADNAYARKRAMPAQIHPMLAHLTKDYFYSDEWIYECKLDGERCITYKKDDAVMLKSRNNISLNNNYPEIQQAIEQLGNIKSAIFDGEIVAFKNGVTSFERLQPRMQSYAQKNKKHQVAVYYYIFDVIYIDGYDVTKMPLIERKRLLKNLGIFKNHIRFSTYIFTSSAENFKAACHKGQEGLMVKYAQSAYVQKRSSQWLKFKCIARQEFVIAGFTDPAGARTGFGALLLGYYKNGILHYAGKVGTGFDEKTLRDLREKFNSIISTKSPFNVFELSTRTIHWLRPKMVCEVGFTEWTRDNKLRHPRYVGLRLDKSAHDVVKE